MTTPSGSGRHSKRLRHSNGSDRRRSVRYPGSAISSLKSLSLRNGLEVQLINISTGGALIESQCNLRPSTAVFLRLVTGDRVYQLAGRVLRSAVSGLQSGVRYQSAICFDKALMLFEGKDDSTPTTILEKPVEKTTGEEVSATETPPMGAANDGIGGAGKFVTVVAHVPPFGPDILEMFGVNNW